MCKKASPLSPTGFPRNFQVENIIASLKDKFTREDFPSKACEEAEEDCFVLQAFNGKSADEDSNGCAKCIRDGALIIATHRCMDCTCLLCFEHASIHTKVPASRGHSIVGLEGVVCEEHPSQLLDVFCTSHKVVVCRDCGLYKHGSCTKRPLQVSLVNFSD